MAQEYKLILKHADEPGYTPDIECYLRHGGYDALKKALAMPAKDLADGKKQSAQEQIRDAVKAKGLNNLSVPREIKVVPEIPKLGTGKIDYPGLQTLIANSK